jgi:spermidine synthase
MRTRLLTPLVLVSGCCALIYQVAWLRLLRLVFGTSTAATAAVMAVFLGGLGVGALVLGRRADHSRNPVRFYSQLEFGVAVTAVLSPALIALVGMLYIRLGGTAALGLFGGTALRLFLSALVLGVPTFLMGGTLPAVARAAESVRDVHRRSLGVLYGVNTLGAVAGTMWATFIALEKLGVRATIWSAAALNLIVALAAFILSRRVPDIEPGPSSLKAERHASKTPVSAPAGLVLTAAGIVGFAFLVMELVWYRMLTPLLGGSSYTFGLILAVALLGIGAGGLLYAVVRNRPTPLGFAFTCALEALFIALPYALGDRLALFALGDRQSAITFGAVVWGWLKVTMIVVFPAAAVAGYQFPLLVGLLGRGEERVGADVGRAYATNTFGAIVGSLAGGFGLMPLMTAPRVWLGAVYLLVALATVVVAISIRSGDSRRRGIAPIVAAVLAIGFCQAQGPTAFWRHSPIGAGRMHLDLSDRNAVQLALNTERLEMMWDADGVESSVGVDRANGLAFDVNGKTDGNVIGDAPTQVMLGLLGAALHPNPKRALVIGLGTGETAGWLAQVPSIEAVDVYELEPAIVRVAEEAAPANHDALKNPKVHVIIGDARELLLTSKATYDLIASEPSNPYRAGIASLFTKEFYDAVAARLGPSGVFVQWVQAYEVRPDAMRSIVATLGGVFRSVETWELQLNKDIGFVASRDGLIHDVARTRARMETEPYRSALALVWGVGGAEGLYSGVVGNRDFAADYKRAGPAPLNTDDRTYLEFAFARSVGESADNTLAEMRQLARVRQRGEPTLLNGSLDWSEVAERRATRATAEGVKMQVVQPTDSALKARQGARLAYGAENFSSARQLWASQSTEPSVLGDLRLVAESFAIAGDSSAVRYIEALRAFQPVEAEALTALYSARTANRGAAVDHFIQALRTYRVHPWANRALIMRSFDAVGSTLDDAASVRVFEVLREPFAVRALDIARLEVRSAIGLRPGFEQYCVDALAPLEPNVPWNEALLRERDKCYSNFNPALAAKARADYEKFLSNANRTR